MIRADKIKGWVFDIDDTLMLERSYVASGILAVGKWLNERQLGTEFASVAQAHFDSGARGNVFNLALADLGISIDEKLVDELVRVFRTHKPSVELEHDAVRLTEKLRSSHRLGVVSDGHLASQRRKADAMRLTEFMSPLVLTDMWGGEFWKPHERGFRSVEKAWGLKGEELVYIGDNPAKDFTAPSRLGWQTVRIIREGGEHAKATGNESEIMLTIHSLDELLALL